MTHIISTQQQLQHKENRHGALLIVARRIVAHGAAHKNRKIQVEDENGHVAHNLAAGEIQEAVPIGEHRVQQRRKRDCEKRPQWPFEASAKRRAGTHVTRHVVQKVAHHEHDGDGNAKKAEYELRDVAQAAVLFPAFLTSATHVFRAAAHAAGA